MSHWCDEHNLPRPEGGRIPTETLIYFAVVASRRIDFLPVALRVYLPYLMRFRVGEA